MAVPISGPDIRQRAPQLGVRQERWQVIEHYDHPDVEDRAGGDSADRQVGERRATEQPDIAGRRGRDCFRQRLSSLVHPPSGEREDPHGDATARTVADDMT
jgi:hypothetical protein